MKKINKISDLFNYEYTEKMYFIILLLWVASPLIEYIFKNYLDLYYTFYFSFSIYIIGIFGLFLYSVYLIKLFKESKINIKRFIPEILILILVFISFISTILSKNSYLSFFGESYRKEGLLVYIMYIGFMLLSSMIINKKYIKYILKSIVIVGLIITILPLFKSDFTYLNFSNVFHQFNHYGYYLMINVMLSAFLFIDDKNLIKKIIYFLIYIFFLYLLIRNDTFGSYLAVFISLIVLLFYSIMKKYQRLNIILLILGFIITSFIVSNYDIKIGERVNFESTKGLISRNISTLNKDVKNIISKNEKSINKAGTGRGKLWKWAINYTLEHPIIGGGMECLRDYYIKNNITYNDRPHNIFLQTSSFIGIPGALVYLILILYIGISSLKLIGKDNIKVMIYFTAMCYFISSIFGNTMYYTSPYFAILLGLLIGIIRRKDEISNE